MAEILACFRPGPRSWLAPILGRRIDRILFAATKADYLHHSPARAARRDRRGAGARTRARGRSSRGAETRALSIASLRATVEETVTRDGREVDVVRGRLAGTGAEVALYPGSLPEDPAAILAPARQGAGGVDRRRLPGHPLRAAGPEAGAGEGLPHIRLDRAAEFLIGDRLMSRPDDPFVIPADELPPVAGRPGRGAAAAGRGAARRGDAAGDAARGAPAGAAAGCSGPRSAASSPRRLGRGLRLPDRAARALPDARQGRAGADGAAGLIVLVQVVRELWAFRRLARIDGFRAEAAAAHAAADRDAAVALSERLARFYGGRPELRWGARAAGGAARGRCSTPTRSSR